ncbi:TetR family transcriptional regulator [Alicyclobacillus acidoterrestris]|nr:TetR family transcriptional regulator [Alicyclobacillus acidoterrestris]
MRQKDENKREAIFTATLQLLNEIGFADISMSKIARHANVSSSTIYVYFESKEDMFRKLYLNVKEKMSRGMGANLTLSMPVVDAHEQMIRNLVDFVVSNKDYFLFLEQFSSSPMIVRLGLGEEAKQMFHPIYELIERGKREKQLKPIDNSLLLSFIYYPVMSFARSHFYDGTKANDENLNMVIRMSWDAIKA